MASLPGALPLERSSITWLISAILASMSRRKFGRCHQGGDPLSIAQNMVLSNGPVAGSCRSPDLDSMGATLFTCGPRATLIF